MQLFQVIQIANKFKGHKDDVVKLYDLTSLSTNEFEENKTRQPRTDIDDDHVSYAKDDGPFTIPVAMLLYKVAKNMKNSTEVIEAKQAGSIKALLENAIALLPKEQYPQIVTSSYYLLSDLYIPSGIDPISPKFNDEIGSESSDSMYDEESDEIESSNSSTCVDDNGIRCDNEMHIVNAIVNTTENTNLNEKRKNNSFRPPPLFGTINERCSNALTTY